MKNKFHQTTLIALIIFGFYFESCTLAAETLSCRSAQDKILGFAGLGKTGKLTEVARGEFPECKKYPNIPQASVRQYAGKLSESLDVVSGPTIGKGNRVLSCDAFTETPDSWGIEFHGESFEDNKANFRVINNLLDSLKVYKVLNRKYVFDLNQKKSNQCSLKKIEADVCLPIRKMLYTATASRPQPEQGHQCERVVATAADCSTFTKLYEILAAAKVKALAAEKTVKKGASIEAARREIAIKILGPAAAKMINKSGLSEKPFTSLFRWPSEFGVTVIKDVNEDAAIYSATFAIDKNGKLGFYPPYANYDLVGIQFERILKNHYSSMQVIDWLEQQKGMQSIASNYYRLTPGDGADFLVRYEVARMFLFGDTCDRLKEYLPKEK